MMKMMRTTFAVLIFCMGATLASAQDSKINETHDRSTKASVYIYQTLPVQARRSTTYPIYADEKQLANLESGRYFIAMLDPGRHTFWSKNKKQGGIVLDVKKGEGYYLRLEAQGTMSTKKQSFTSLPKEKGALEIRQMSPIKPDDIKDRSIVITDYNVFESKPDAN